jgi:2-polyprenyl-3-methyl-5-hydroxy-6-metoxy-1,4-benzoquinol methylase
MELRLGSSRHITPAQSMSQPMTPKINREDTIKRITELRPWYQNISLADGLSTKDLDGDSDIFSGEDIPAPLWRAVRPLLDDLADKSVLDIGCNAGYMSFEAKKLGASRVLGIDSNLGAGVSFLDQAEFCRELLGLDVDFKEVSLFDFKPEKSFDVVIFCGVLYHLENFATGIEKVKSFVNKGGQVILETASEPITRTTYGLGYHGDTTTFFVPSPAVLRPLVEEYGFTIERQVDLPSRTILAMRAHDTCMPCGLDLTE